MDIKEHYSHTMCDPMTLYEAIEIIVVHVIQLLVI